MGRDPNEQSVLQMTKASQLLQFIAEDLGLIERLLDEMMPLLITQVRPAIKLSNSPRALWLGQDEWKYGQNPERGKWWNENTTIYIQRAILNDENTLKRVLAHELCHHDAALSAYIPFLKDIDIHTFQKIMKIRGQHDTEWRKVAAKFNAKYGEGFVTEKSDQTYKIDKTNLKEMLIVILQISPGKFGFAVSARISTKQRVLLDKYKSKSEYKITKSNDPRYLRGASIGSGWSVPSEPEIQKKLERLFNEH